MTSSNFRQRTGSDGGGRGWPDCALLLLIAAVWLALAGALRLSAQQPAGQPQQAPPETPTPAEEPAAPGDWAPDLLYNIWNASNPDGAAALYRAAFAAGPVIVPDLEQALKDDRTAEFAAQELAFLGGERAFKALESMVNDPRDLNLRRFYYGALAEIDQPAATRLLLDAVARADKEPDRTVTEAAILALTVRSDPQVAAALGEAENKVHDYVIRDDIENARAVISARAKYLASPEGRAPAVSLERAVRTYFIPALETPEEPAHRTVTPGTRRVVPRRPTAASEAVSVKIQNLTFSPDQSRALAHVEFEVPTAVAEYDMVLQKKLGDWTLASVWLGPEREKTPAPAAPEKKP